MNDFEYKKYEGDYEKVHYDIITRGGIKYEMCWPNAGNFHSFEGVRILGELVDVYRISSKHPLMMSRKK